jgi:DNA-binding beta-propeller fold protein YncE
MQPPIVASGAMPQTSLIATHARSGQSWMRPETARTKKLYISDVATDNVFVYNYDTGELLGTLVGFSRPGAQCIDARGDIWITDRDAHAAIEYRHGGVARIKRLQTGGNAGGCWIDPTSGNLAVANQETPSGGGDIRVFIRSGFKDYSNPECYYLETPAYDSAGNLYVEAYSATYAVNVCELPHGGKALRKINANEKIYGLATSSGMANISLLATSFMTEAKRRRYTKPRNNSRAH